MMTSVWMAYAILISAMTYIAAAAAEHLLWIWRAPRRAAWLVALLVGTVAPVAIPAWRATSHHPAIAAPATPTADARHLTIVSSHSAIPIQSLAASEPRDFVSNSAGRRWGQRVESAVPVLWFATSALLVLFAVISYARLERQSAAWPEVDIDGARVVVTPDCGPAVLGIWRQRILIPSWALSLDTEARALMLRHEREHLRARDPQLLLFAIFTALLFPWNAALWVIVRRLRLAVELDCDNRVLRGRDDARAYGSLLLSVCARRGPEMRFTVALAERSSMLERRIRSMTAVTPRRRLHSSIPQLAAVALLSVGAARTPSPRPPSFGNLRSGAPNRAATRRAAQASAAPTADRDNSSTAAADALPLPRLASPESLPHITIAWENASIETVIASFSAFSHRQITTAPDVGGLITATLVDQPWRQALETIMARHGLRVEFRSDSSVYISTVRDSESRPQESGAQPPAGHLVSGTVDNADTGAPIPNAHINVAGIQLIGAPNETWSDDRGRFSLRVPDGEAWLDAYARGYEFTRITLGTTDSVALFHGHGTGDCSALDTTPTTGQHERHQIQPVFEPVLIINGKVMGDATPTRRACEHRPSRLFYGGIRIF